MNRRVDLPIRTYNQTYIQKFYRGLETERKSYRLVWYKRSFAP
jgi:hypothetical protein